MNVEQLCKISEEYGVVCMKYNHDTAVFDDFAEFITLCLDFAGRRICDKYVERLLHFEGDIWDLMTIVIECYNEIKRFFRGAYL